MECATCEGLLTELCVCRPAVIESEMPTEAEEGMMAVLNVPSPGPRRQGRPSQNRRRSSMADLTGRLLADDSLDGPTGLAMLAPPGSAGSVAPPSSPEDSPADRVRHAGTPSAHLSGFHQAPATRSRLFWGGAQLLSNASESRLWKVSVPALQCGRCRQGHDNRAAPGGHISAWGCR